MPYKKKLMDTTIGEVANNLIFKDDLEWATVEEIRKETIWPSEWNSVIGLIPYIKRLKGDLRGIEVGTGKGESAYLLLEECPNIKSLYTIDHYKEYKNWKEIVPQDKQDKARDLAFKNLSVFNNRVGMYDPDVSFELNSMDFIFLDGGDSYEAVTSDLDRYYPLLKSKGIMSGHNYQLETVRNAMMEWRDRNKVRNPVNRVTNFSYFWIKT